MTLPGRQRTHQPYDSRETFPYGYVTVERYPATAPPHPQVSLHTGTPPRHHTPSTPRARVATLRGVTVGAFLLILGLSGRLTELVTYDQITAPLRRAAGTGLLGYAIHCKRCVGLWISAAVVTAWYYLPPPLFTAIAAAGTANLLWCIASDLLEPPPPPAEEAQQPTRRARGARPVTPTEARR